MRTACAICVLLLPSERQRESKNMKVFSTLLAACVFFSLAEAELNLTDEQKGKLAVHHAACSKEITVSDEVLQNLLDGVFPENQSFKDYLLCMSKKIGFQDGSGKVQKEIIISKLRHSIEDPAKAEEYTEKCLVEDEDPAEVVYKVVKCLQETTPKLIFAQ